MTIKEIEASQLNYWLTSDVPIKPIIIDVREPWEHEIAKIEQAELIPMNSIPQKLETLERTQPYVLFCHHGLRSMQVALYLEKNGFTDVSNLLGGIEAWRQKIDPSISSY